MAERALESGVLWEQKDDETDRAYAAFVAYRDLGPHHRSLTSVARQLGKNRELMGRWSRRHGWVERVQAWDEEQRHQFDVSMAQAREEMADFHARVARAGLNVVAKAIIGSPEEGIDPLNPASISASEIARLADIFSRMERAARGEPDVSFREITREDREQGADPARVILLSDWLRGQEEEE